MYGILEFYGQARLGLGIAYWLTSHWVERYLLYKTRQLELPVMPLEGGLNMLSVGLLHNSQINRKSDQSWKLKLSLAFPIGWVTDSYQIWELKLCFCRWVMDDCEFWETKLCLGLPVRWVMDAHQSWVCELCLGLSIGCHVLSLNMVK